MKKYFFTLTCICSVISAQSQITIAEARAMAEGTVVTVKGLVLNGAELGDIRYLQDNTGNIGAFNTTLLDGVQRGDSIIVSGPLYNYNALLEISPASSVTIINSGNTLPSPTIITCSGGYIESNEGKLVQIIDASFTSTGTFSTAGSGTNYDVTDATATGQIRVVTTTNIDGTPIPTEVVNITGIMGQYAPSGTGGYQVLPRDLLDIAAPGAPPVISTGLTQTNITTTSFTVNFETINSGNTIIYYGLTTALGSTQSDAAMVTSHTLNLTGLTAGTVYYVKAASVSASNDTSYSAIAAMATVSNSSGQIKIWFNNTVDNSVSTGVNAIYVADKLDDSIKYFIDHALYSIDLSIYNMDNDNGIVTALNDAYARGVTVRVICDAGVNATAYATLNIGAGNKKLSPTGTTPEGDYYGINHNKFLIVDAISTDPNDMWVVTGSANYTDQQLKLDKQNTIAIQDESLAKAYRLEFEEMFGGNFGPEKTNNTPHQFIINGKQVELYFSPSDETETHIIDEINQADYDLYFAVYSYTRYGISYAISDAVDRGVFAAGMYDETDATDSTAITILEDALGPTFFHYSGSNLLHHKYLIVDPNCPQGDAAVLTGSHNWTTSANSRNDENTLVVHDSTIANIYYQEFNQRYKDEGGNIFVEGKCDLVGVQPEMQIADNIKLYPNPANNYIWVETKNNYEGIVTIMNMNGEIVLQKNIAGTKTQIDVSELSSGLYIINFRNADGMMSEKIVKQ